MKFVSKKFYQKKFSELTGKLSVVDSVERD